MLLIVVPGKSRVPLTNGAYADVSTPSIWESIVGGHCVIDYHSSDGKSGRITLWKSFVDMPTFLISDGTNGSFFCLYHFDTDARLLYVDPRQTFVSFPADNWSCLSNVVCSTPWQIKEANLSEWKKALDLISRLPPGEFRRQQIPIYKVMSRRIGWSKSHIQGMMQSQIQKMVNAGSTQWPIITNDRFPRTTSSWKWKGQSDN